MFKSLATGAIGVRADLPRAAELAARFGFADVQVSIDEVVTLGVEHAREILARAGVRASSFGLPLDYRRPEPEFAAALSTLRGQCTVARDLGLTRTATWVPSWHDELDCGANYAFHRDRFGRIAAVCKEYGIRVGLEFLGPKTLRDGKKYPFIHTMDGMLGLCRDIGAGNVGLLLDAYHWYTAGGALPDLGRLSDADVVLVHVNDAPAGIPLDQQLDQVRALPGETGVIGVPAFLRAMQGIGYSGPVIVEPFSARVKALPAEEAVRVTSEALDAVWPHGEA
jgi:2-keto-myo-inositol isomerase